MRRVILLVVMGLIGSIAFAQDAGKKPTEQEMMEAMMKYGTPGEEHKKLAMMAGTFDAEVTHKMSADAPEQKGTGKMVNEMILEGRYLKGDYSGDFQGMPFKGVSLTGFDKMREKYVNMWMDSMSTMMMTSEGTAEGASGPITLKCQFDCPVRKEKVSMRQVITVQDNDHHTLDMYATEGGKEFKTMTIKYTRAKDATAGK